MANRRHLKILAQGVLTWNQWRSSNPDIKPNLRGANFKGRELVGADFSDADIRSTNFTGANLNGVIFKRALAGLQRWRAILLVLLSWFLALISGLLSEFIGYLVVLIFDTNSWSNQVLGVISLIILLMFLYVTIQGGIVASSQKSARAFMVAFPIGVVLFGACAVVMGETANASVIVSIFSRALVGAGVGVMMAVIVVTAATAITSAFFVAGLWSGVIAISLAGIGAGIIASMGMVIIATVAAEGITFFSFYLVWQAFKGNKKYAVIGNLAITIANIGGTSFKNANLIDADLRRATLENTNFLNANLIGADLTGAIVKSTSLKKAILGG
ncbi:MAG: pentapeptide repeat-containing protein [Prochloraceae cyanobacterium]|nr:pentapeptide repeat-containing protein [Prochloraceae cyanobacterium]